jgi:hypothetical protein
MRKIEMASLQLLESGNNWKVYTDGKEKFIKIRGRLSYPAFGNKKVNKDEESGKTRENWGGVIMLPKATHKEAHDRFKAMIEEIKANAVNEKTGKKGVIIESGNLCLKDGDEKEDEAMHGHWLITFSDSKRQPAIRRKSGEIMMDKDEVDNLFYGGCWGEVLLRPWYFNGKAKNDPKPYPKRIACGFTGAQFVKDDEPFGTGRIDDSDAWGSIEEDDDDDGL